MVKFETQPAPEGYYGPDEEASMRPDEKVKVPAVDSTAEGYFNPGRVFLDHKARCDAVQRRGHQQRLQRVMDNFNVIGADNLLDFERETFDIVRKELEKVEALMVAAGQTP